VRGAGAVQAEDGLRAVVFSPTPMGIFEQSVALAERGWLGTMAVDYYCDLSRPPLRWLPEGRLTRYLRRRHHPGLDGRRVATRPWPSMLTRIGMRTARAETNHDRWVFWHNAQFDRWVASRLPAAGNLVVGYESASLRTFRRARELGLPRVLYQPIACAETAMRLLAEERQRFPALAASLRYSWFPEEELERRREERRLADAILCASSFTRQSLIDAGVDAEKIVVEPYGVDQAMFVPSEDKHARFSVIWAGSYTQTKGIGYLLEALARSPVPGIELVLAGYPHGVDAVAAYESRLSVRRLGYITRPVLAREMARCHAHVFPTVIEGFGRNIIEAMACGLPVITTRHGAGPDLIDDGVTGFIIPIRDVDAICERLAWLADHPHEAVAMGRRARDRVAGLVPADYRRRFATRIAEVWEGRRRDGRPRPARGGRR
jgi:alpha-maltose-1-phosphate synthase